jgi:putative transposase
MDETYIRVKGKWTYLYRAVDKLGKTLDFMLSERRNKAAATKFFARALEVNGLPRKIVIDKSGANTAGITAINRMRKRFGCPIAIEMVRIKYLNNIIEQDHRTIKKRIQPMLGFKSFVSASATLEGIEVANMIRKGQLKGFVANSDVGPAKLLDTLTYAARAANWAKGQSPGVN